MPINLPRAYKSHIRCVLQRAMDLGPPSTIGLMQKAQKLTRELGVVKNEGQTRLLDDNTGLKIQRSRYEPLGPLPTWSARSLVSGLHT